MRARITSISDVVALQLCTGCGVCAHLEPGRFRMSDALEHGRRPLEIPDAAPETGEALACCPGISLKHSPREQCYAAGFAMLSDDWGPVLSVWEGYATNIDIRLAGSSGGAATALALYGIEREGMAGTLHVGSRDDVPYLNETRFSTDRASLMTGAGSRYSPASPCDGLNQVEAATSPVVFIGKPCDVAAVVAAAGRRPSLRAKLGMIVSFFCAGAPSTKGTLELLKANGISDPSRVRTLRYRGNGWPGRWTARYADGDAHETERQLSYEDSWGFLQKFRQWRCYVCPDHTGEFADVSVGDPWYRPPQDGDPGRSLIVARTHRGYEFVKSAEKAGYLVLETENLSLLPRSQPNLLETRSALWGRMLALRVMGAAVPRYSGFNLFNAWLKNLTARQKLQSIVGTAKRVLRKRLYYRVDVWKKGS